MPCLAAHKIKPLGIKQDGSRRSFITQRLPKFLFNELWKYS